MLGRSGLPVAFVKRAALREVSRPCARFAGFGNSTNHRFISYTSDELNPLDFSNYPYPVYVAYHLSPKRVALSFLPPKHKSNNDLHAKNQSQASAPEKDSISIGWADVADVEGSATSTKSPVITSAGSFVLNPVFARTLRQVMADHVAEDPGWQNQAAIQGNGALNINDQRVYIPFGRVGDPEDIVGIVRIQDGQIIPNSFEDMPTWRPISPSGGLFQLSEFLQRRLLSKLSSES